MNNNEHLIWERYAQAYNVEDDKLVMFEALQEAHNMLEEAKVSQDMVDQINAQLGLGNPLTLDQLTQIQTITNPGVGAAIGGALGKVGGWLAGKGQAAGAAVKNQVTNPESGLRQGLGSAGEAIKAGAQNVAQGVQTGAQNVAQGVQAGVRAGTQAAVDQFGNSRAAAVGDATGDEPVDSTSQRDPRTGRYVGGNRSGVQYAENKQTQIDSLRPGWGSKVINHIDYSDNSGSAGFGR